MVKEPLQLLLWRRSVALCGGGHEELLKVQQTVVVGIEYLGWKIEEWYFYSYLVIK